MSISVSRLKKLLLYLVLFFSVDTVLYGTNMNRVCLFVPRIVGLIFILIEILIFFDKISKIRIKGVVCFFLILLLLVSGFVNNEDVVTVISRIIFITVAYFVTECFDINEFLDIYLKFMYVISVAAIIMEIIYYVTPKVITIFPTITNTAGLMYKTIGICSLEIGQHGFCRASGIFWEPGAFAVYLNIAIYFCLFYKSRIDYKKIAIYIVALLITVSTTGYITLFILVFLYAVPKEKGRKINLNKCIMVLCIVAIVIILIFNNPILFDSLFGKVINNTSTTRVRIASIIGGFQIALSKPLFGVFASNISPLMKVYQPSSGGMLTNTIIYQFAAYGLPFGLLYSISSIRFFMKKGHNIFLTIGLIIFWCVLFISENFYSYLSYIFVFYSFEKSESNKNILTEQCAYLK